MNIYSNSSNSFKGYDARHLTGFFMRSNCCGIANEMKAIGDKEGFKIFSPQKRAKGFLYDCSETLPAYRNDTLFLWAQDKWMIVKDKLLAYDLENVTSSIKQFFDLKFDSIQQCLRNRKKTALFNSLALSLAAMSDIQDRLEDEEKNSPSSCHIEGGNTFIVNNNKEDNLIIGMDEIGKFKLTDIMKMFEVNKVTVVPQMDFHLDLFIRPLDNKRILLTDDQKSLEVLQKGYDKILDYLKKHPNEEPKAYSDILNKFMKVKSELQSQITKNPYSKTDEVEKILQGAGFEVIRVPGRVYRVNGNGDEETFLQHYCNYMNANVLKNKDGDLVYITNKSLVDTMLGLTPELSEKFRFSFENHFVNSILPYVKKEHIYFVSGENNAVAIDMLFLNQGGIHCACTEIPQRN